MKSTKGVILTMLMITIIILLILICVVIYKKTSNNIEEGNEQTNVTNTQNVENEEIIYKEKINAKFGNYTGLVEKKYVIGILQDTMMHNLNREEERIFIKFGKDTKTDDEDKIIEIIKYVNTKEEFNVRTEYDNNGFVNLVIITE